MKVKAEICSSCERFKNIRTYGDKGEIIYVDMCKTTSIGENSISEVCFEEVSDDCNRKMEYMVMEQK